MTVLNTLANTVNPFNILSNFSRSSRITDVLTNYRFHLMDVSFSSPVVFSLSAGFQFASSPEITVEIKEFKEGTFEFPRKVVTGAKVNDIVLHRGAKFFDSDFYDWTTACVRGTGPVIKQIRKNIMLIQYADISTGVNSSTAPLLFQSFTDLATFVPARSWMLYDCLAVSYKAGSDFDANSGEMSISEMTLSPRLIEEFSSGV